jgi:hypothetical protein
MNVRGGDDEEDRENRDNDPREGQDMGESEEESEADDTEIVETFILTFHNGDFDAEFDDALRFDRDTPLLDRPTQTSYIKPNNWRERNQSGCRT